MKSLITSAFLLFIVQFKLAGQSFEPGYIVNTENDTVHGFLEEKIDTELSFEVTFKKEKTSESKNLERSDLDAFGYDYGRIFRKIKYKNRRTGEEHSVFAKLVQSGKIDVFIWRREENRKSDLFLINNETGEIVHLVRPRKELITTPEGKMVSREDQVYLGLLDYIKGDTVGQKKVKYIEKKLLKDLRAYNEKYEEEFPVFSYKEKKSREYTIIAGKAVNGESFAQVPRIRAAVMLNTTSVERTQLFSYMTGIFYSYRDKEKVVEIPDRRLWDGTINYKRQLVSVIPIGVKLQGRSNTLQPYTYVGGGVGAVQLEHLVIENATIIGRETHYHLGLTMVFGAGLRVKLGSGYLVTEVAPSSEGLFLNVGYAF